jgi:hypothetical protein
LDDLIINWERFIGSNLTLFGINISLCCCWLDRQFENNGFVTVVVVFVEFNVDDDVPLLLFAVRERWLERKWEYQSFGIGNVWLHNSQRCGRVPESWVLTWLLKLPIVR